MKKGIQGRVIVSFNVETDGSITDAKVVKAVDSLLNNEALRIVKSMPKWKPGEMMSKGKTVLTRCKYTIPVIFKLEEKKQSVTGTGF
jgi:protein TonB